MKIKIGKNFFVAIGVLALISGCMASKDEKVTKKDSNTLKMFKSGVDFEKAPSLAGLELNEQNDYKVWIGKRDMAMYDEQEFQVIQSQIIDTWTKSWKSKDVGQFASLFDTTSTITRMPLELNTEKSKMVGKHIEQHSWKNPSKTFALLSGAEMKSNVSGYLNQFSKIVDLDLVTQGVRSNSKGMRNDDFTMRVAELEMRFDLRGLDANQKRRNDRGKILATVEKDKSGKWNLKKIAFTKGETLIANKSAFRDATVSSGLDKATTYQRHEAIRRGGYALSISDYNGDGEQDLYVGTMKEGEVLLGDAKGNFKVSDKMGIEGDTLVKSAISADFDNDNKKDLLLVRFDPSYKDAKRNNDVHYYKNMGDNKYKRVQAVTHTNDMNFAMPAAVADYNKDGLLDVYIGYPGAQDFTFFESMRNNSEGLSPQGLYFNDGNGKFKDVTASSLPKRDVYESCCSLFPHSAMALDYDLNGDMDIVVIDDAGRLSPFYVNKGDGTFHQSAEAVGAKMQDYGMSLSAGDVGNDGTLDMIYTSVNFHSFERINKSLEMNFHYGDKPERFSFYGSKGLRYFKAHKTEDGIKYVDHTEVAGLDFAGEGMGGVQFVDYNNDGHLDVYVANGLWSGTSEESSQDISSLFARADRILPDLLNNLKALGENWYDHHGKERSQSIIMEILSNFKGDVSTGDKSESGARPSLAGNQRNRLFRNNGNDTFTEVGFLEGVDSIADGYIIALTDIGNDGKVDLVLRNGDPGTVDIKYHPVELFINQSEEDNNAVILTLEGSGKKSNFDAIGAIATAEVKGQKYVRHLTANNGTAQSERFLHFGIGKAKKIDKLVVQFPSGQKKVLLDVPAGRHHIVEDKGNFVSSITE